MNDLVRMSLVSRFLTDRVAIVTASTKGVGFAIAKRLGLNGASVVVCSRKASNVDDAVSALRVEGINAAGIPTHIGIAADRKKLVEFAVERFGKLDILVSNAAVSPHKGDLLSISESQWDKMLMINVKSGLQLTQEAVPHLEASGRGAVVFVASVAAYAPLHSVGAYSVMKSSLVGVNKALSQSLAHKKIRVNAIAPGMVAESGVSSSVLGGTGVVGLGVALARPGAVDECAEAVAFLVSDDSSYITGETLGVHGGMQARI